jgi:uncharacterized protein
MSAAFGDLRVASMRARSLARAMLVLGIAFQASVGWCDERTPRLEGWVTDLANVLSADQRQRLATKLAEYEKQTSHQIVVLTVPTLAGERIESFSLRVANAAGIGQRGVDNGVLVALAMKERAVRIELGYGFERHVSNDRARQIIATMTPAFRNADYFGGLERGLDALMADGRRFVVPRDGRKAR